MPFLGQRVQRFGQQLEIPHLESDFAAAGAKEMPCRPDEIADVEIPPKEVVGFLSQGIATQIDLDVPAAIFDVGES